MLTQTPEASDGPGRDCSGPEGFSETDRSVGMAWIIRDGVLANLYGTLTGGVFLTGFALLLGAGEVLIGLLGVMPRLAQLAQPLGSYFVERLHMRKSISVWVFGPARMVWVVVLVLPWLAGYTGGRSESALMILFWVATASSLMAGFAATSWLAWMADLIPEKVRGDFFGRRTMLAGGTSAVVGYGAGRFIDWWEAGHGKDDPAGFLIVFTLATICGLASWYTLIRCAEPPIAQEPEEEQTPFWAMVREAWQDANFRSLIHSNSILTAGVWLCSPFFSVYMIKVMGLPYSLMSIMVACSSAGSLLAVRFMGALSDHFGNRPVILFCLIGTGILPLFWLPCAGGIWWPVLVAHLVSGSSWSGVMLAQTNLVFKITPDRHKSVYIGIFYALSAAPSLVAPLIAGWFLERSGDLHWQVGSWEFVNYHLLFVVSTFLRLAAIPVFRRVQEPRSRKVAHMFRVLSHVRTMNPAIGLHYMLLMSHAATDRTHRAADAVRAAADRLAEGYASYRRRSGGAQEDEEPPADSE